MLPRFLVTKEEKRTKAIIQLIIFKRYCVYIFQEFMIYFSILLLPNIEQIKFKGLCFVSAVLITSTSISHGSQMDLTNEGRSWCEDALFHACLLKFCLVCSYFVTLPYFLNKLGVKT